MSLVGSMLMQIAVTTYVLVGRGTVGNPTNPQDHVLVFPPGTLILGADAIPPGGYNNDSSLAITNEPQEFPLENGVPAGKTPRGAWWCPQDNIGTLPRFHQIFVRAASNGNFLRTYIDAGQVGDLRITIYTAWE